MGRRRLDAPRIYNIKLYLRAGQDDDLITFLEAAPSKLRARAVMQALRSGRLDAVVDGLPSDADVGAALEALIG